ncbi:MAG: hypothetical protein JNJ86_17125 [Chitinophagaceae bacterium]|jgi:hypothetical protein|nr:hypothetical protein [Chitinophagaceae bacterium]
MKKIITLSLLAGFVFASCGPKIYKSSEFDSALAKHKTVAILPADVTTKLRPNEAKKITAEQLADINQRTGYDIQDKMYSWFLRRAEKYAYTVTFQDVTRTNALLKQAGITYETLASKDRTELAQLLGVDAVLQNRSSMDKPMSEGAAIAVGVIFGAWGNTNSVQTTINIHDGKSGNLLWKYDYQASGSVGSSTDRLVNALMRNASKKFPYSVK